MSTPRDGSGPLDDRHHAIREQIGAYALDQLTGGERLAVAAHVGNCAECRDELVQLQALAGPLAALDPDDIPAPRDPATDPHAPTAAGFAALRDRVRAEAAASTLGSAFPKVGGAPAHLDRSDGTGYGDRTLYIDRHHGADTVHLTEARGRAHTRTPVDSPADGPADSDRSTDDRAERAGNVVPLRGRRFARFAVAAAAAAAVFVVGVGIGTVAGPGFGSSEPFEPVAVQALDPAVAAEAGLVPHTWGVEVRLTASGFRPGETYRATVRDGSGRTVSAGEFIGTGAQEMECNLNSSILREDATGFTITDEAGRPVLVSSI